MSVVVSYGRCKEVMHRYRSSSDVNEIIVSLGCAVACAMSRHGRPPTACKGTSGNDAELRAASPEVMHINRNRYENFPWSRAVRSAASDRRSSRRTRSWTTCSNKSGRVRFLAVLLFQLPGQQYTGRTVPVRSTAVSSNSLDVELGGSGPTTWRCLFQTVGSATFGPIL